MDPIATTTTILALAIVVFLTNKFSPALVAMGVTLALFVTGMVTFDEALSGFGDPLFVYLAGLFVVSESLDATGITAWAGQQLTRRVGDKRSAVLIAAMLLAAALTAVISVNGAVAALVPVGVLLAARTGQQPSQVLIPIAFAAHAGSMLTLLGTPLNPLVSELSVEAGGRPIGFFEFALVGVPMLVGVVVIVVALGPALLPRRTPATTPRDLGDYAETLAREHSLAVGQTALSYEEGATEIVIPPRSTFLGDEVYPGMLTESGELIVVAVQRGGHNLDHAHLRAGDVLVLRGTWEALEHKTTSTDVLPVDEPDHVRRQSVKLGRRSWLALGVVLVMCLLLAVDVAPPAMVVLGAALVLGLTRVVTLAQAQRSISMVTLLVVAGMIPMSVAIQTSGTADLVSHGLVSWLGESSPRLLLAAIVVIILVLGQFLSNLAMLLVVAPVALAITETSGISPLPMVMAMTVAGAASFLTPVATPGNLMIQDPGAYRFTDYWKLGLPCLLLFGAIAIFLVPVIWPF